MPQKFLHDALLESYRPRTKNVGPDDDEGIYSTQGKLDKDGILTEIWHAPAGLAIIKHQIHPNQTCTTVSEQLVPWDGPD